MAKKNTKKTSASKKSTRAKTTRKKTTKGRSKVKVQESPLKRRVRADDPIIVRDATLPPDKLILDGVDVSREPRFTISEVSKFFFARSAHWIRWLERSGAFKLDGKKVGAKRTAEGMRYYTLGDVELMAHALATKGKINAAQLQHALRLVLTEAQLYEYL